MMEEVKLMLLLLLAECSNLYHLLLMNIIIWNCQGALKPGFQSHLRDLVQKHNPAIFVVMETRIGGAKAKEITNRLPFDSAIHIDTIGYVGGL